VERKSPRIEVGDQEAVVDGGYPRKSSTSEVGEQEAGGVRKSPRIEVGEQEGVVVVGEVPTRKASSGDGEQEAVVVGGLPTRKASSGDGEQETVVVGGSPTRKASCGDGEQETVVVGGSPTRKASCGDDEQEAVVVGGSPTRKASCGDGEQEAVVDGGLLTTTKGSSGDGGQVTVVERKSPRVEVSEQEEAVVDGKSPRKSPNSEDGEQEAFVGGTLTSAGGGQEAVVVKKSPRKSPNSEGGEQEAIVVKKSPRKTPTSEDGEQEAVVARKTPTSEGSEQETVVDGESPRKTLTSEGGEQEAVVERKSPRIEVGDQEAVVDGGYPRKSSTSEVGEQEAGGVRKSPRIEVGEQEGVVVVGEVPTRKASSGDGEQEAVVVGGLPTRKASSGDGEQETVVVGGSPTRKASCGDGEQETVVVGGSPTRKASCGDDEQEAVVVGGSPTRKASCGDGEQEAVVDGGLLTTTKGSSGDGGQVTVVERKSPRVEVSEQEEAVVDGKSPRKSPNSEDGEQEAFVGGTLTSAGGGQEAVVVKKSPRKSPNSEGGEQEAIVVKKSPRKTPTSEDGEQEAVVARKTPTSEGSGQEAVVVGGLPTRKASCGDDEQEAVVVGGLLTTTKGSSGDGGQAGVVERKSPRIEVGEQEEAVVAGKSPRKTPTSEGGKQETVVDGKSPRKTPTSKDGKQEAVVARKSPRKTLTSEGGEQETVVERKSPRKTLTSEGGEQEVVVTTEPPTTKELTYGDDEREYGVVEARSSGGPQQEGVTPNPSQHLLELEVVPASKPPKRRPSLGQRHSTGSILLEGSTEMRAERVKTTPEKISKNKKVFKKTPKKKRNDSTKMPKRTVSDKRIKKRRSSSTPNLQLPLMDVPPVDNWNKLEQRSQEEQQALNAKKKKLTTPGRKASKVIKKSTSQDLSNIKPKANQTSVKKSGKKRKKSRRRRDGWGDSSSMILRKAEKKFHHSRKTSVSDIAIKKENKRRFALTNKEGPSPRILPIKYPTTRPKKTQYDPLDDGEVLSMSGGANSGLPLDDASAEFLKKRKELHNQHMSRKRSITNIFTGDKEKDSKSINIEKWTKDLTNAYRMQEGEYKRQIAQLKKENVQLGKKMAEIQEENKVLHLMLNNVVLEKNPPESSETTVIPAQDGNSSTYKVLTIDETISEQSTNVRRSLSFKEVHSKTFEKVDRSDLQRSTSLESVQAKSYTLDPKDLMRDCQTQIPKQDKKQTGKKRVTSSEIFHNRSKLLSQIKEIKRKRDQSLILAGSLRIKTPPPLVGDEIVVRSPRKEKESRVLLEAIRIRNFFIKDEQSYINLLTCLVEVYYKPLRERASSLSEKILTKEEIDNIFSQDITVMLAMHESLQSELEESRISWLDILSKIIPNLKVYVSYAQSYANSYRILEDRNINSSVFNSFLKGRRAELWKRGEFVAPEKEGISVLTSLLSKPLNRLHSYQETLENVLLRTSNTSSDFPKLEHLIEQTKELNKMIDCEKKKFEHMYRLSEIQRKFVENSDTNFSLFDNSRRTFIKEGFLQYRTIDSTLSLSKKLSEPSYRRFYFLLFSDILIQAKTKKDDLLSIKYIRYLNHLTFIENPEGSSNKAFVMSEKSSDKKMEFKAETIEEKNKWVWDISMTEFPDS